MSIDSTILKIRSLEARVNLVLLVDHGGRAGSNFFQCVFDKHEGLIFVL